MFTRGNIFCAYPRGNRFYVYPRKYILCLPIRGTLCLPEEIYFVPTQEEIDFMFIRGKYILCLPKRK